MNDKVDIYKDEKPFSSWDSRIDWNKLNKLRKENPRIMYELFPDEYMPDGTERGDF